jgi:glutathione S-transferase
MPEKVAAQLELWQTEWCPSSHRVRQRLTELGLPYLVRQVPVDRGDREQLERATGVRSIPVLVAGAQSIAGEEAILAHLDNTYPEPPEAAQQREKAAKIKRKELEHACPQLTSATP